MGKNSLAFHIHLKFFTSAARRKANTKTPLYKMEFPSETDDDSSEEVTRCICLKTHTTGLMIQCEGCEVWQHCECIGLKKKSIPKKYWCELCTDSAELSSSNNAFSSRALSPLSALTTSAKILEKLDFSSNLNGVKSATEHQHYTSKKRSTMNSREAAQWEDISLINSIIDENEKKEELLQENKAPKIDIKEQAVESELLDTKVCNRSLSPQKFENIKSEKNTAPQEAQTDPPDLRMHSLSPECPQQAGLVEEDSKVFVKRKRPYKKRKNNPDNLPNYNAKLNLSSTASKRASSIDPDTNNTNNRSNSSDLTAKKFTIFEMKRRVKKMVEYMNSINLSTIQTKESQQYNDSSVDSMEIDESSSSSNSQIEQFKKNFLTRNINSVKKRDIFASRNNFSDAEKQEIVEMYNRLNKSLEKFQKKYLSRCKEMY
ncbi:hypothetical protein HK099_003937 [Clydaea vesicula]|uniref:Zinc finger PHD-type domain-containing protein n=1 Tax=Clydaea vesicula TaxID=447962 RepID=A0AAD5Y0K7_9FUNG|nr:hypothetical protein HK099_003937 [Clydaea vesicula]